MKTELFEQFYYPQNYFHFNGNSVDETTINIWIQQMFDKIAIQAQQEPKRQDFFSTISTGNTKVLLEVYKQTNGKFTCYLSIATAYKQKSAMDVDINSQ